MDTRSGHTDRPTLLSIDETPPYEIDNPDPQAPLLLVCDHARNTIPRVLNDLGLDPIVLGEHIALDIGCETLARRLARLLQGSLILGRFSRLVIDLNRHLSDSTSIVSSADGTLVPGNLNLTTAQRSCRTEEVFVPYHNAVSAQVEHIRTTQGAPALIAVHSFTPQLGCENRPWEVGILWVDDQRISQPLLHSMRRDSDLCVGDNQPYDAREQVGYTIETHGGAVGLPHVLIEVRQDLIQTESGALAWAECLAGHLAPILAQPDLYHRRVPG